VLLHREPGVYWWNSNTTVSVRRNLMLIRVKRTVSKDKLHLAFAITAWIANKMY